MVLSTVIDISNDTFRLIAPGDKGGTQYHAVWVPDVDIRVYGPIRGFGWQPPDDWVEWSDEGFLVVAGGVLQLDLGPNEQIYAQAVDANGTVSCLFTNVDQPANPLQFD